MSWQPIETAPKDRTTVDLWAKCWDSDTDTFEWQRFCDCRWSGDGWYGLAAGFFATHWQPLPAPPES